MNRILIILLVLFLSSCCSKTTKDQNLTNGEPKPLIQVADTNEDLIKYYPKDFPFIEGGTLIQMNMSVFPEELQDLHPVILAYDTSQEELRDIVKAALEKHEWDYFMEEDTYPTLVYRFIATKNESKVMASVMDLGGIIVLQVIDNTGY